MPLGRISQTLIEEPIPEIKPEVLERIANETHVPVKIVSRCFCAVHSVPLVVGICKLFLCDNVHIDSIPRIAELIRDEMNSKRLREMVSLEVSKRPCRNFKREYELRSERNKEIDIAKLKEKTVERCFSKLVWKNCFEGFPHEKAETVHGIYRVYPEGMWNFFSHNKKHAYEQDCRSLNNGKSACQKHHEELEKKVD